MILEEITRQHFCISICMCVGTDNGTCHEHERIMHARNNQKQTKIAFHALVTWSHQNMLEQQYILSLLVRHEVLTVLTHYKRVAFGI